MTDIRPRSLARIWIAVAAAVFLVLGYLPIQGAANAATTNVAGGRISGKITVPANENLSELYVFVEAGCVADCADPTEDAWNAGTARVKADGTYLIAELAAGKYEVNAYTGGGELLQRWYSTGAGPGPASEVLVKAGSQVTNINIAMMADPTKGSIRGTVAGPSQTASTGRVLVSVFDARGQQVDGRYSDAKGKYRLDGLAAGTYKIGFSRSSTSTLAAQFYRDLPESAGISAAKTIAVGKGTTVTGIDAKLKTGAAITGKVVGVDGKPRKGLAVYAYNDKLKLIDHGTLTDANGAFKIQGLTNSTYYVAAGRYYGDRQIWLGDATTEAKSKTVRTNTTGTTAVGTISFAEAAKKTLTAAPVPKVSGSAVVGKTLTATAGTWTPAPVALKYQWLRNGKAVSGATKASYKLVAADTGTRISVKVTGSKSGYRTIAKTSAATAAVTGVLSVAPVPKVSGTAVVGKTLTATAGVWKPAPVSLKYQWLRNGKVVAGATKLSYKLVNADRGAKISVRVTGSKAGYVAVAKTSAATTAVKGVLSATPVPKISGTAAVGKTLKATAGVWKPAPVSLKYQWLRNGKVIAGATKTSYKLATADKGAKVSVRVTGSKTGYVVVAKSSAATIAVRAR